MHYIFQKKSPFSFGGKVIFELVYQSPPHIRLPKSGYLKSTASNRQTVRLAKMVLNQPKIDTVRCWVQLILPDYWSKSCLSLLNLPRCLKITLFWAHVQNILKVHKHVTSICSPVHHIQPIGQLNWFKKWRTSPIFRRQNYTCRQNGILFPTFCRV